MDAGRQDEVLSILQLAKDWAIPITGEGNELKLARHRLFAKIFRHGTS